MGFLSRFFSSTSPRTRPLDQLLASTRDDPRSRREFYAAILEATLWTPGEREGADASIRPYDLGGRAAILLFSSPGKLDKLLGADTPRFAAPGRELLAALPPFESVILDYDSSVSKELTPSEVRALVDGSIMSTSDSLPATVLGQPKHYPVALMTALRDALPARIDVSAAYIAQRYVDGVDAEPAIVIAFETEMTDEEFQTMRGRAVKLAESLGEERIEFVRLEADALGEYLRSEVKPFYERDA